jgi:hypothetical protein
MEKKKYSIEIPEYLSIDRYQKLQSLEHLSDLGKIVRTIHVFTDIPEDEIKTWAISDLGKVGKDFSNKVNTNPEFYPMWQHKGINYGYVDMSTMSMGEFIDLEQLCKEPVKNLHEIMAVLYRPVVKHRFDKLKWKAQHNVQLMQNKVDNAFKWYTVKEYDNNERHVDAAVMKDLPAGFALGALNFFLGTANLHWINSLSSLKTLKTEKMQKLLTKQTLEALTDTGDGLRQYIRSPKQAFSISQGKLVSLS